MATGEYEIGMVGLGVMGRNLALNMADHGFSVAGYDNDGLKVQALLKECNKFLDSSESLESLTSLDSLDSLT